MNEKVILKLVPALPQGRISTEEIIEAYRSTGSVWKAGKRLGLTGQSVHERLRHIDYPMANRKWTASEISELRALVGELPLFKVAEQLGRTYAGVACKINELGIGVGTKTGPRKFKRKEVFPKAVLVKYAKLIDVDGELVTRFARKNGLSLEMLCRSFEMKMPEWWAGYKARTVTVPEKICAYCGKSFLPSSRQRFCTRRCADQNRLNGEYFGGKRRQTIGLAEEACQLCHKHTPSHLASHHVFGKENDTDNEFLVALCRGCHQIVGLLAVREFLADSFGWESLIQLVELRRIGPERRMVGDGFEVYVEIERLSDKDLADEFAPGFAEWVS